MTTSERIGQWWASRQQTTADVEARYGPETNWPEHYKRRATEAEAAAEYAYLHPRRTPLTTNQHILHLLLTVFTCGVWLPVWIIRAMAGNRRR